MTIQFRFDLFDAHIMLVDIGYNIGLQLFSISTRYLQHRCLFKIESAYDNVRKSGYFRLHIFFIRVINKDWLDRSREDMIERHFPRKKNDHD